MTIVLNFSFNQYNQNKYDNSPLKKVCRRKYVAAKSSTVWKTWKIVSEEVSRFTVLKSCYAPVSQCFITSQYISKEIDEEPVKKNLCEIVL